MASIDQLKAANKKLRKSLYSVSIDNLISGKEPTPDRMAIFSEYRPTYGSTVVIATYNPNCWAAKLPLWKIPHHDTYVGGDGKDSLGKSALITENIVIVTEHGTEVEWTYLVWIMPNEQIIARRISDSIHNVGDFWFRLLWLEEPAPVNLIVPMVDPTKIADLTNTPCLLIKNNTNTTGIKEAAVINFLENPLAGYCLFGASFNNPQRSKFYRQAVGGDSGSPVFLVRGKELVYVTNLTNAGDTQSAGPSSIQHHQAILDGVKTLNARYGKTSLPTYV